MTGTNPAPIRTAKQGKPPAFSALKKYFLHKPVFHFLLIFLLGFAVYSNTFHMPFHFDDIHSIVENHKLRDLGSLWLPAGLRWFGYLTFAVNYKLHRLDVVGYHVGNLLIHISNAILVYFLVLFTFRTPAAVGGISGKMTALLAALIFTVHPLQTQAVTYIVQRFASLATLFYLLSLVLYIRWGLGNEGAENGGQNTDKNRRTARVQPVYWYLASLLSAVLGMKTKEVVFTLPIVIGCYDAIFFEHSLRKRIYSLAPFLMTMLIIPFDVFTSRQTFDNLIGDMSDGAPLPRLDYLFTEFAVISTYLRLLVLPIRQNLDYDYPVFHSWMPASSGPSCSSS